MKNHIKFSVTVPAYKAKYLEECIRSVLAQTYKEFELIIVNDNSPQDLDSIVRNIHDNRIQYYKNEKGFGAEHVVGNWNKCLEYASGDFLICMGDDDKLLPNCLEDYVTIINKYPSLDIYHSRTQIIDSDSDIIDLQEARPEFESAYSMLFHRLKKLRVQYIGDFLFRTSRLREIGGFYNLPYACCSDDISALICVANKGIANTLMPGFQYRDNNQTISRTQNLQGAIFSYDKAFKWYKDFLTVEPTDRLDKQYRRILQTKMLDRFRFDRISYLIVKDIAQGGIASFFYWKKNHIDFGFSKKDFIRISSKAVLLRLKRIFKKVTL